MSDEDSFNRGFEIDDDSFVDDIFMDDSFASDGDRASDRMTSHEVTTDWREIVYTEHDSAKEVYLEPSDYIALTIAAIQTVFLPLVILIVFLFAIGIFLGFIF